MEKQRIPHSVTPLVRKILCTASACILTMAMAPGLSFAAQSVTVDGTEYAQAGGGAGWSWDGADSLMLDGYDGGAILAVGNLTITVSNGNTIRSTTGTDTAPNNDIAAPEDRSGENTVPASEAAPDSSSDVAADTLPADGMTAVTPADEAAAAAPADAPAAATPTDAPAITPADGTAAAAPADEAAAVTPAEGTAAAAPADAPGNVAPTDASSVAASSAVAPAGSAAAAVLSDPASAVAPADSTLSSGSSAFEPVSSVFSPSALQYTDSAIKFSNGTLTIVGMPGSSLHLASTKHGIYGTGAPDQTSLDLTLTLRNVTADIQSDGVTWLSGIYVSNRATGGNSAVNIIDSNIAIDAKSPNRQPDAILVSANDGTAELNITNSSVVANAEGLEGTWGIGAQGTKGASINLSGCSITDPTVAGIGTFTIDYEDGRGEFQVAAIATGSGEATQDDVLTAVTITANPKPTPPTPVTPTEPTIVPAASTSSVTPDAVSVMPKTGDSSPITLLVMTLLAGAALIAAATRRSHPSR